MIPKPDDDAADQLKVDDDAADQLEVDDDAADQLEVDDDAADQLEVEVEDEAHAEPRAEEGLSVPTRVDSLGRPSDHVEVSNFAAAAHWDPRFWRRR